MKADVNSVLSLIAATIFADKHIYASEVETFLKSTVKLKPVLRLEPKLTEAKLLSWYEMNKDEIRDKVSTPYFKDWFYSLLERLKDFPEKEAILETMKKIAYADGEVHVSERALVALAGRYWDL